MFMALGARAASEWDHGEDIHPDALFRNKAALIAYEMFIGVFSDEEKATSIIWIARVASWATSVIKDLSCGLKVVARGGKEPHFLKTMYNSLLLVTTANLQAEYLTSLRPSLSTEGVMLL